MLRRKRVADDAASAGVGPAAEHRGQATGGRGASRPKLSLEEAVFGSGAASAAETGVLGADGAGAATDDDDDDDDEEEESGDDDDEKDDGAAWVDEDDDVVTVDVAARKQARKLRRAENEKELGGVAYAARLREQFEKTHGSRPQWASTDGARKDDGSDDSDGDDDDDSEGEGVDGDGSSASPHDASVPTIRAGRMLATAQRGVLPKGVIDTTRVRDANAAAPNKAAVNVAQFHPTASAMFTAGLDKTLRIFQVDGRDNALVQSIHFPDLPIASGAFVNHGREIILSGRRHFFYSYELETGAVRKVHELQGRSEKSLEFMFASRDGAQLAFTGLSGEVVLVSPKTKQVIGSVKMNGSARTVAFGPEGQMHTAGSDGKVYLWDHRNRKRCVHVFADEGAVSCCALAVSPDGRHVACGSDAGVVNIYDDSCYRSQAPTPLKAIMNLTTVIHKLEFHPDGQMLAMASRVKKQAMRLFHVPSLTTFQNWPPSGAQLGYVNALSFSANGGYLTVGNDKGKALLFRLNQYSRV